MANKEHLAILKQGVRAWNSWRAKNTEIPELRDASLVGVYLDGANLSGANFANADLAGAHLIDAHLFDVNLATADLTGADLSGANLGGAYLGVTRLCDAKLVGAHLANAEIVAADLSGADLGGANLTIAKLRAVNLRYSRFHNVIISGTIFAACDLSLASGLDSVRHDGPCSIGLDTIYRSRGRIPESFLRGCGIPESFITQMHSLVGAEDGIQFYSCFISYSSKDDEFARRLHARMLDSHLQVWFAPEDIQGGKKLHEQIEEAIRIYDKLLIVLSKASLQSEWVMTELRKAFKAEKQSGKRKLFPVRLVDMETIKAWECFDADSGKDLAVELREYFIPDFSNWKDHDSFETAFARLFKDLKAEPPTA